MSKIIKHVYVLLKHKHESFSSFTNGLRNCRSLEKLFCFPCNIFSLSEKLVLKAVSTAAKYTCLFLSRILYIIKKSIQFRRKKIVFFIYLLKYSICINKVTRLNKKIKQLTHLKIGYDSIIFFEYYIRKNEIKLIILT